MTSHHQDHHLRRRMREVTERQWGAVSHDQLLACGFTEQRIRVMIRRGELIVLFRGVYAVGHARLPVLGSVHAAYLAAGPDAFVSRASAAALRGLRAHPPWVEVTRPTGHTPPRRAGLLLHRTRTPIDRTEVRSLYGLPVATVPRIIVDLAATERPGEIQQLIRQSIRTGQFNLEALRHAIEAHPHRPGTALARAALERYLPGSENRRSWLETQFQSHQRADPRLPEPRYNERLLGYEVDVTWHRQRVALELDGRRYHVAVEDFDRDRAKDRTLMRHGWRPLRISDVEWEHDRAAVLDDLYAVLGV